MSDFKESPSQTAGPYVHIGCAPQTAGLEQRGMGAPFGHKMIAGVTPGHEMTLDITVLDGEGAPVKDALIEIWQAGPEGSYAPTAQFSNWGRQAADLTTGQARFQTLKPGALKGQAPHVLVWIAARGINLALTSRIYFPDENNASDPFMIAAGDRAETLVAAKAEPGYTHVIRLQGPKETVFFDV
ncbi:protocatechuate 3,4-dioxygenase subunit alpha [Roseobacter weihaiensis]|uniref:protocatechuate 3,4-dioxygenase subunit alpha n=1 Tax=Roseobacter weihaiensis TaxID=2763262 RepID=UPI001D0A6677|nr:protocatechuate 3,4-dioxygenase subunit alpha [Roseobacter sp. H9]